MYNVIASIFLLCFPAGNLLMLFYFTSLYDYTICKLAITVMANFKFKKIKNKKIKEKKMKLIRFILFLFLLLINTHFVIHHYGPMHIFVNRASTDDHTLTFQT